MCRNFALLAAVTLAACSASEPANELDLLTGYLCEDGKYFRLELLGAQARVTSAAGTHVLSQASSLEGNRYESGGAVLILREDEADFRGVPGGPFEHCRPMRRG